MKVLNIVNKELKVFVSNITANLFVFIITPLILGFLYGLLYSNIINPSVELKNVDVYIVNQDNGEYGEAFYDLLVSDKLKFINLIPSSNKKLTNDLSKNRDALGIIIPEQFTYDINHRKKTAVEIINYGPMTIEKNIIANMTEQFADTLNYNLNVSLISSVIDMEETIEQNIYMNQQSFVVTEDVKIVDKLSAYEKMITAAFTIMSFFIAINLASDLLKERENNVIKRLSASDIRKQGFYFGVLLFVFIISLVITSTYYFLTYFIIFRLKVNVMNLFVGILTHTLFITSLYGLLIGIFRKERTLKALIMPVVMMLMFFGGSFFPLDSYKGAALIAKYTPNYNLSKIFEGILLNQGFEQIMFEIVIVLVISAVFMIVGNIRFSLREE